MAVAMKIVTFGDAEKIARKLTRLGGAVLNERPVLRRVLLDMYEAEKALFRSQGRRGGGAWKRLKDDTVAKKGMPIIMFTEGAKPGYGSGQDLLYKSLTQKKAKYQEVRMGRTSLAFGTSRPGAAAHEFGYNNIPQRELIKFTPGDLGKWTKWVNEYFMKAYKSAAEEK